jgi:hypothetical protein
MNLVLLPHSKHILWGDVADCIVQADVVVMRDVALH